MEPGQDAIASVQCGTCGQEGYNAKVPATWEPPPGTPLIRR